jgi:hypothetical protein
MYRRLIFVVFLFAFCGASAQILDTTQHRDKQEIINMKHDSVTSKPFVPKPGKYKLYNPDSTHSPRKALFRSMYFAGLGQIYNRHGLWWRLPLIYGGLGALAYNIYSNGSDYNRFLAESEWRAHGRSGPEPLPNYNGIDLTQYGDQTIYDYKDNLRRNRDLSIFSFIGVWGINMVDAYVEAKFIHSYTMDDDLSFKITPSLMGTPAGIPVYASNFNYTFTPSIKLTLLFK